MVHVRVTCLRSWGQVHHALRATSLPKECFQAQREQLKTQPTGAQQAPELVSGHPPNFYHHTLVFVHLFDNRVWGIGLSELRLRWPTSFSVSRSATIAATTYWCGGSLTSSMFLEPCSCATAARGSIVVSRWVRSGRQAACSRSDCPACFPGSY